MSERYYEDSCGFLRQDNGKGLGRSFSIPEIIEKLNQIDSLTAENQKLKDDYERLLNEYTMSDICRLQVPDGWVPGNALEAARGWKAGCDEYLKENQKLTAERDEVQAKVDEFVASIDGWKRDLGAQPGQTLTQALQAWMKRLAEAEGERDAAINHERDHLQQIAQLTLNLSAAKTERDALKREVDVEKSIRELVAKQCQDQYEVSKEAVARVKKLEDGIRLFERRWNNSDDGCEDSAYRQLFVLLPPEEPKSENPASDGAEDEHCDCDCGSCEYSNACEEPQPQPVPEQADGSVEDETEELSRKVGSKLFVFTQKVRSVDWLHNAMDLVRDRDSQLKREARMAALEEVATRLRGAVKCDGYLKLTVAEEIIRNLKAKEV